MVADHTVGFKVRDLLDLIVALGAADALTRELAYLNVDVLLVVSGIVIGGLFILALALALTLTLTGPHIIILLLIRLSLIEAQVSKEPTLLHDIIFCLRPYA